MDAILSSAILDSLPYGLCVSDSQGVIVQVNPALEQLLGRSSSQCLGLPLDQWLGQSMADQTQVLSWTVAVSQALANKQTTYLDLPVDFGPSDERQASVAAVVAPWLDPNTGRSGAILVFRDSSNEKDLKGWRTRFLSLLAHELGSPVTTITTASDLLVAHLDQGDTQSWRLIQIIRAEADRCRRLIVQSLSAPATRPTPTLPVKKLVTLRPLLQRVAQIYKIRKTGHRIRVEVPSDLPFVWGDADRIQEILSNLVDNAVRYSPGGTEIMLAAEARQDEILVSVADRGLGVSEKDVERLFEPFFRGAPQEEGVEGEGLGLPIARALAQDLGGDLWYEEQPGGGARFCFTLPRAEGDVNGDL